MRRYSKNEVVLVRYPFSDLSSSKVRPAVVVNGRHPSPDLLIVPLTSRTESLYLGEFQLTDWPKAGLNVPTAVKRWIYTIEGSLVIKGIGKLRGSSAAEAVRAAAKLAPRSPVAWAEPCRRTASARQEADIPAAECGKLRPSR